MCILYTGNYIITYFIGTKSELDLTVNEYSLHPHILYLLFSHNNIVKYDTFKYVSK